MIHRITSYSPIASVALTLVPFAFATATAGPFPPAVADDTYGVAQGGVVNGIPTANDDNDGIPDINDAINLIQGSSLARNVDADPLFFEPDEVWLESGGTIFLIGLTAGQANTVGVYTDLGVGSVQTPLLGPSSGFGFAGDGTAASPFPAALVGLGEGTSYGWYLDAGGSVDYFSEAGLNPAAFDHMMTFDLPDADGESVYIDFGAGAVEVTLANPYLIAWEDLPFSGGTLGDDDYDDMMYIIDQVAAPPPGFCPVGLYKESKAVAELPINDFESIVAPSIKFNPQPGVIITDVVIDVDIEHENVGDLVISLVHTSSSGETKEVELVSRPPCAGALASDPEGKYYFGTDPSLEPLGVGGCSGTLVPQCYAVAPSNPDGLTVFRFQPKGDGEWELHISDEASGGVGIIHNWSVHLLCNTVPTSVEASSWGSIKAHYRD